MVTPRERIYHFFCVSAHGIRKINFRAIFRGNVLPSLKASKYSTYKTSPGEREREREREREKGRKNKRETAKTQSIYRETRRRVGSPLHWIPRKFTGGELNRAYGHRKENIFPWCARSTRDKVTLFPCRATFNPGSQKRNSSGLFALALFPPRIPTLPVVCTAANLPGEKARAGEGT